jgi:chromosomal replication initiation ATPase DnaA
MTPTELSTAFRIIRFICERYRVTVADIEGPRRHDRVVWPRRCAIALVHRHTAMDNTTIGLLFNRCRTDVVASINTVNDLVKTNQPRGREFIALAQTLAFNDH